MATTPPRKTELVPTFIRRRVEGAGWDGFGPAGAGWDGFGPAGTGSGGAGGGAVRAGWHGPIIPARSPSRDGRRRRPHPYRQPPVHRPGHHGILVDISGFVGLGIDGRTEGRRRGGELLPRIAGITGRP